MARNIMHALNVVPDGRQPKHGFDLMSFETFTQKGGQLNIVGVRDTVPNSDYRMAVDAFTRTLPCNTANFAHIKENWYFVHVPLGLINRAAYQTLVQRKQNYSALDMGIARFPTFDLATVLCRCLEIAHLDLTLEVNQKFRDVHGFNIGRQAFRLFDMLGYGCYLDIVESTFKESGGLTVNQAKLILQTQLFGYAPTANRLAAYQMVWYHFFRNDIYDCEVSAKSFNFDDVTYMSGSEPSYDILTARQVDDFIIDCCQMRYVGHKKDLFMGSMPGTQFGAVSSVSVNVDFAELTGAFVGDSVTPTGSFLGTQATIQSSGLVSKHHHTLNSALGHIGPDYYETIDPVSGNPVPHGRWQDGSGNPLSDTSSSVGTDGFSTGNGGLTYSHSVNSKDGAKIGRTDNLFHDHELSGYTANSYYDEDHPDGYMPTQFVAANYTPAGSISINSITPSGTVNLSGGSVQTSLFDVLSLVQAQAIQKWRQKSMLAGNKTADQFRAHHGEVPRHLIDHLPDFIGSVDNEIQITEITSQADTASSPDESNLGEIAGRGYGASNAKYFNFHSDDYGILLLLHAIVPENTYSSYGFDFGNTMVYYNDFYQSEYTNIGLRAVPKFLLNSLDSQGVPAHPIAPSTGGETFTTDTGVCGFAPAQFNYKQYVSKVHGMFNPSRLDTYDSGVVSRFGFSDMQSFVITRQDLVLPLDAGYLSFPSLNLALTNLYVHPSLFDSIFAINADDSEQTDEFITHAKFICDASLPMPVLGLPQF